MSTRSNTTTTTGGNSNGNSNSNPSNNDRIECTNRPTFDLCYSNWLSGGTVAICAGQVMDSEAYNVCLCQQYFSQWYCFSNFCPEDQTAAQLQSLRVSYCSKVPNFNPTIGFSLGNTAVAAPPPKGTATAVTGSNGQPVLSLPGGGSGGDASGGAAAASPTGPLTALPKNSGAFGGVVVGAGEHLAAVIVVVALVQGLFL
ncbi:hypothetical protein HDU78_000354 [Chytriomyces hyalinus]|nr:hypothetical protein HDU78_000354 [Chytriomyces hyalinus]